MCAPGSDNQTRNKQNKKHWQPGPGSIDYATHKHHMIKVLIADDHAIVRRGLKQIVAETDDIVVGGEAVNGNEVMEQVRGQPFDVVVLDITMPGRNGFDTLKELKLEPVSVLTI
jgi:CheY-like chemotaxis protein